MALDTAASEILDAAEKVRGETAGQLFTKVCNRAVEAGRVVQELAWAALQLDRAVQALTAAIAKWKQNAPADSEIESAKAYYEVQEDYGDDAEKQKAYDRWQDLKAARAKADRELVKACAEMMKVINGLSDNVGDGRGSGWNLPGSPSREPLTPYRPSTPNKPRIAPLPSSPSPRTAPSTDTPAGTETPTPALTRPTAGSTMPTMPQVQTPAPTAPAPIAAANPAPTAARPNARPATDKSLDTGDADPTPVPLPLPLTGTTAGPTATAPAPTPAPPSGPTGNSISGVTTQSEVHGRPGPGTGLSGVTGSNATTATSPAAQPVGHGGGGGYMPPVAGGAAPGTGAPTSKREPDGLRRVDPTLHDPSIVKDGTIAQRRDDEPERKKP